MGIIDKLLDIVKGIGNGIYNTTPRMYSCADTLGDLLHKFRSLRKDRDTIRDLVNEHFSKYKTYINTSGPLIIAYFGPINENTQRLSHNFADMCNQLIHGIDRIDNKYAFYNKDTSLGYWS